MLRKFRSHVRHNVVGYVALFFALGGSASAAFVVSSNSQVGPDTIYGANKPASANDNVVANSIAGTDLAFNSVGTGKVIDNSLTGADISESSLGKVPDASKLDGKDSAEFIQGQGRIVTIDEAAPFSPAGGSNAPVLSLEGFVDINGLCDPASEQLTFIPYSSAIEVLVDSGGADPSHQRVEPNHLGDAVLNATDGMTVSVESGGKLATLFFFTYRFHDSNTNQDFCQFQGHAIVEGA